MDHRFLLIVESELDAIALQYAGGDTYCTIAIGGNSKNPTLFVDHLAQKAQNLLLIPDNDNGGTAMTTKWQQLYPHARICRVPFGKDIGEAAQQGLQLEEWLLAAEKNSTNTRNTRTSETVATIESQSPKTSMQPIIAVQTKTWSLEAQELIAWFGKYLEYIEHSTVPKRAPYSFILMLHETLQQALMVIMWNHCYTSYA